MELSSRKRKILGLLVERYIKTAEPVSSGEIKSEIPGFCGCYIDPDRGVIKVTDIDGAEYKPVVPGLPQGAYHLYDYQFFFRSLQINVGVRTQQYLMEAALAGQEAAQLLTEVIPAS